MLGAELVTKCGGPEVVLALLEKQMVRRARRDDVRMGLEGGG